MLKKLVYQTSQPRITPHTVGLVAEKQLEPLFRSMDLLLVVHLMENTTKHTLILTLHRVIQFTVLLTLCSLQQFALYHR